MPDLLQVDALYTNLADRGFRHVVFKSGSTYYARRADGTLTSSDTALETVLKAATDLRGTVLLTGDASENKIGGTTMSFSGSFSGIDLLADTCLIIDKSVDLRVPNAYTGYVFRDHDQGYMQLILYGQVHEAGTPANDWTFFKLQSDGSSGCINTILQGFGGQINNALCAVELNSTSPGFVNGNYFGGLFIDSTEIGFKFVGSASGPIHHNVFENINIEGELGVGVARQGFKDVCGNDNTFKACNTIDYVTTDTAWNFTSIARGNILIGCTNDDGKYIDLGSQNTVVNCKLGQTNYAVTSFMTRPDLVKYGAYYGSATLGTGDGLFNGRLTAIAVGTGTSSGTFDSSGNYRTVDTAGTINSLSGFQTNALQTMRVLNAYFKSVIQLNNNTNMRVFSGLVASVAAPASAADPLNALEGVGLWFDSAVSANWKRMHNDSVGASTVVDTGVSAATGTLYPVEIFATNDDKFRFVFNGTVTDITSNMPASTTGLAFRTYIENTTGASRVIRIYNVILRSDK